MAADVSATLDLDAKQFHSTLAAIPPEVSRTTAKITAEGEKAGKGFHSGFSGALGGLKSSIGGVLGGLGIGLGVSSIVNQFEQAITKGSQLNDIASRFHVSAEQLQLIGNAASQDGVSLEQVAKAMNFVELNSKKATIEGSNVNQALKDLKINADTFASASPAEKLLQISDGLAKSAKDGQAYADVATLIGSKNTALFATFEKGRGSIEATAKAMGIMSNETVAAMDKAGDAINAFNNKKTIKFGEAIVETQKFGGWLEWLNDKLKAVVEKTGLKPSDAAVKGLTAGAAGALVPGGGAFGGKGAGSSFEPENIPVTESAKAYGGEIPTKVTGEEYKTGEVEAPEVSERRQHLLRLQSSLESKGLTLATASAADIGAEERRLTTQEGVEKDQEAKDKFFKDSAEAKEAFFHPGKALAEELAQLSPESASGDISSKLDEQTTILGEIRDGVTEGWGNY